MASCSLLHSLRAVSRKAIGSANSSVLLFFIIFPIRFCNSIKQPPKKARFTLRNSPAEIFLSLKTRYFSANIFTSSFFGNGNDVPAASVSGNLIQSEVLLVLFFRFHKAEAFLLRLSLWTVVRIQYVVRPFRRILPHLRTRSSPNPSLFSFSISSHNIFPDSLKRYKLTLNLFYHIISRFAIKCWKFFSPLKHFPLAVPTGRTMACTLLGSAQRPWGGSLPLLRQNISQLLLLAIRKKRETALLTAAADTKVNLPDFPTTFLFIFRDRFVSFLQKSCSCPWCNVCSARQTGFYPPNLDYISFYNIIYVIIRKFRESRSAPP